MGTIYRPNKMRIQADISFYSDSFKAFKYAIINAIKPIEVASIEKFFKWKMVAIYLNFR